MTLSSPQPLTRILRIVPKGARPARKANNLTTVCESMVCKVWDPVCRTTLSVSASSYKG
jgi:hypothetical protein